MVILIFFFLQIIVINLKVCWALIVLWTMMYLHFIVIGPCVRMNYINKYRFTSHNIIIYRDVARVFWQKRSVCVFFFCSTAARWEFRSNFSIFLANRMREPRKLITGHRGLWICAHNNRYGKYLVYNKVLERFSKLYKRVPIHHADRRINKQCNVNCIGKCFFHRPLALHFTANIIYYMNGYSLNTKGAHFQCITNITCLYDRINRLVSTPTTRKKII